MHKKILYSLLIQRVSLFLFFSFLVTMTLTAQCLQGDCLNGQGTFVYPSGSKYIGNFKNGEIHGQGVCNYADGSQYEGQWSHRFPQGKGTKTYPDGTQRTGQWYQGQPVDAKGQILELTARGDGAVATNDIQSGCVQGDCDGGYGTYVYIDGSKYEGQFRNGRLHGQGTWFYTDGDKFTGGFKNNYSHGDGIIYHADGRETAGHWVNGEYREPAAPVAAKEGCIEGNCKNGIGTFIYEEGAAKYMGEFKDQFPHGTGTCYYANGEKYEGEWNQGSFSGNGTLFMLDGSKVNGLWKEGTYIGLPTSGEGRTSEAAPPINAGLDASGKSTKVWAVLIGVSNYSHMPALKYTDDDAYRIFAHLKSPEGGALDDGQIQILIDDDATHAKIKSTMQTVFSKAGPNDLIMLYFSGHGLNGSFLPIDFDGFNNKLLHEEVKEILDQSPAKYKICIADACHSGSMLASRGTISETLDRYYRTLAQAKPGTALIMSSKSTETSLESSGLRQGVFSHFLIRGLRGEADRTTDGVVSIQELYSYIFENVRSYTGMRQSPVILGEYDDSMTISVVRE